MAAWHLLPVALLANLFFVAADMTTLFLRSPEDAVAPLNDSVTFDCRLRSPAERIRWKHQGRTLPQQQQPAVHSGRQDRGHMKASVQVHVDSVDKAGEYQCVAWFGTAALMSAPARLSVAHLEPFPESTAAVVDITVPRNATIVLPCEPPESVPPAYLRFVKDSKHLPHYTASGPGRLLLSGVTEVDSGRYRCEAHNHITAQMVRSPRIFSVSVSSGSVPAKPPTFIDDPPKLRTYSVKAGDNVTLWCWALGQPAPTTTWFREGHLQLHPERSTMVPGGLHLSTVAPEDAGRYTCLLHNQHGSIELHAQLQVLEPPILLREPKVGTVQEGEDVVLECEFQGSPQPNISWVFNGNAVNNDSHITVVGGNLAIQKADLKHAGIFQCFGRNELGTVYGSVQLHVAPRAVSVNPEELTENGHDMDEDGGGKRLDGHKGSKERRKNNHNHARMIPPSKPQVTRLSDTSVMVRWKVTPNRGLPIQFFKVQYSRKSRGGGKHQSWMTNNGDIPPHIHTYEVDNLEPNQTYRFRIAAAYSNDDNKLSQNLRHFFLKSGVDVKMPAPLLFGTTSEAPTVIRLYWQQPDASMLEGYYVYYRAASSAGDYLHVTVEDPDAKTFDVGHLQPDTMYELKLQGFTKDAASPFSAILTQKTLPLPVTEPSTTDPGDVARSNGGAQVVVKTVEAGGGNVLYLAVGCSVGAVTALIALGAVGWLLYKKKTAAREDTPGGENQDKIPETVSKGNGSLQNGQPPQQLNGKLNITTNPLADAEAETLTQVIRSQNNNCEELDDAAATEASTELACWRQQQQQQPTIQSSPENYV